MTDLALLDEAQLEPTPLPLFGRWLDDAARAGLPEPGAMTLATAATDGTPSARVVLLRGYDERGFTFYTSYLGQKARDLEQNPRAALVLAWTSLHRQIRIEGTASKVTAEESDAYFRQRPRGHCLSAVASPQSQVVASRRVLEDRVAELAKEYQDRDVPRPATWGGYRIRAHSIEFWQGRENRLHDRLRYRLQSNGSWLLERLAP